MVMVMERGNEVDASWQNVTSYKGYSEVLSASSGLLLPAFGESVL